MLQLPNAKLRRMQDRKLQSRSRCQARLQQHLAEQVKGRSPIQRVNTPKRKQSTVTLFILECQADAALLHSRAEIVRWVAESVWPFKIVEDRGFQSLMKTGDQGTTYRQRQPFLKMLD